MQADDRAEYEADKVQQIFAVVLGEVNRAKKLLEHIRPRPSRRLADACSNIS